MQITPAKDSKHQPILDYATLHLRLEAPRHGLRQHELYRALRGPKALCRFMEHHIFAVWDFMSLVKALQAKLTCVETPWIPVGDPGMRRYVNEIVLEEESDEDGHGGFTSHFELYLSAMEQVGANTRPARDLIARLTRGEERDQALQNCGAPAGAAEFNRVTFDIIDRGLLHEIASAFAVGREGLIPPMFTNILESIEVEGEVSTSILRRYLSKHIEMDGEHHGPMSQRLLESVCGTAPTKWIAAEAVARKTLTARRELWDAVQHEIQNPELCIEFPQGVSLRAQNAQAPGS
ncbi:MAG: hypothetical protein ACI97A_002942 [Planctomycetota bacterium]|jgi:hypothetical protein